LISPISQSVYPRVCAMMSEAPEKAFQFIQRLLLYQGTGTFLLSLTLFLLSNTATAVLLGPKFHDAAETLRILSFLPFVIGLSNVFGIQTMLPLGMRSAFRNLLIGSGLVNLVLLVPLAHYYSANGAASSVLITECIVTLAMAVVLQRKQIPIFLAKGPANVPL
jgi:PST family polysaccharide transporter